MGSKLSCMDLAAKLPSGRINEDVAKRAEMFFGREEERSIDRARRQERDKGGGAEGRGRRVRVDRVGGWRWRWRWCFAAYEEV
jgi:hypothetical protein